MFIAMQNGQNAAGQEVHGIFGSITISQIIGAVVAVAIVWVVYLLLSHGIRLLEKTDRIPSTIVLSVRRVLRWLALLAAIVLAMQSFGILQSAWASLTAIFAMIAIGFVAVWSILSNALCSIIILMARPFRVGDVLEITPEGFRGTVVNFTLLYTTLRAEPSQDSDGDGEARDQQKTGQKEEDEPEFIQIPNNLFFQRVIKRRPTERGIELNTQLLEEADADV